uniref:toxin-antitoxin system YwqK family antitoxin n=1 Tax=uncultured Draconibacterium sp. TaxID=1573823 RepID=UPI00321787E7
MRIILLLLLFIPTSVFSQINQTDANGLRQGKWEKKQVNGRPIYEGEFKDDKPVGEWKRYHPGGQVKAVIIYNGDTAQTQLFDVWRKKVAEGNYVNQKKEGIWKIYKQNRVVADEEFKFGLKHGTSHQFYDTGEVMEEKQWENDKEHGNHKVFYKNNKPYMQCKMQYGMRNGLFIVYSENGTQELTGEYKNNLRHGEWKYYDKEGKYIYSLIYDKGQILNPGVRDSIDNLQMQSLEKNKGTILDPEKFMQDPTEYMMKNKIKQ